MDIRDIERRVFRKLISNPRTLAANLNKISPEDFSNRIARETISALGQGGNSIHYAPSREYFEIILRDRIVDPQELQSTAAALASYASNPEDQHDLDLLIKELKNDRMCREVARILQDTVNGLEPARVEETYDNLLKRLLSLPMSGSLSHSVGTLKEVTADIEERLAMYFRQARMKFACGPRAFNEAIGGFAPGELIVLTAGTGSGKSALMLWWAEQFLRGGANVLYVTLEMSYEETMERYHSLVTGLSSKKVRNKSFSKDEMAEYIEGLIARSKELSYASAFRRECASILDRSDPRHALELSRKYPDRKEKFFVLDIPKNCSPSRVEREIAKLSLDNPIHIVIVDYLNIMEPNFRSKDWVREQGSIAKDMKEVARKTGVIMMSGAQLNTSNLNAGDRITTDSIKYARAISENADWLIGFNRDPNDLAMKQIRLELAKHRFSASATALLEIDFDTMQFIDLGHADQAPAAAPTQRDEKEERRRAYVS